MNLHQICVLVVALLLLVLIALFPPHFLDGGIIGGTVFVPLWSTPRPTDFDTGITWLLWADEAGSVFIMALSSCLLLREAANRAGRAAVLFVWVLFIGNAVSMAKDNNTIASAELGTMIAVSLSLTLLVISLCLQFTGARRV